MAAGDDTLHLSRAVVALPGTAAALRAFRAKGRLQLAVIVKATFAFALDDDLTLDAPRPIVRAEVHHGNSPAQSIRLTYDLAPFLGKADVIFTGHAHAQPPGSTELLVRLAVYNREGPVLDKQLVVEDQAGFSAIPLVYERTFGGADVPENPVGSRTPSIADPRQPGRPAGLGPISRAWHARRRLLGVTPRKALDGDIAEIPDSFDWSYFQAAPPDQRIDYLRGDEWIVMEGLHPTYLFRTRLPGAQARARVHGLAAFGIEEGHEIDLVADTLHIDGAEERCTLVWRQTVALQDEAALAAVRVVAGVELPDAPIAWPDPGELPPLVVDEVSAEHPLAKTQDTLTTDPSAHPAAALPFQPAPARPVAPRFGAPPPIDRASTGTFALDMASEPAPVAPALSAPKAPEAYSPWSAGAPATPKKPTIPPPPLATPAAPAQVVRPLSAAMASTAAAGVVAPPLVAPVAPVQETAAPVPAPAPEAAEAPLLDLLWFDRKILPRARLQPAWKPLLEALQDKVHDPDIDAPELHQSPVEGEERREVFEILAHGEALRVEGLRAAVKGAVRADRRFVAPLVLLAGEIDLAFDPLDTMKTMVAALTPHAQGDEALQKALEAARESAKDPDLLGAAAFEGHTARLRELYAQGKRTVPPATIEAQVARVLVERRRYLKRPVFGGPHVRASLHLRGEGGVIPLYLPEPTSALLPLSRRFEARTIVETHLATDEQDSHPLALRAVALARATPPPRDF